MSIEGMKSVPEILKQVSINDGELHFCLTHYTRAIISMKALGERYALVFSDLLREHERLMGYARSRGWTDTQLRDYRIL